MIRLSQPQSRIFLNPSRFRVVCAGRRFGKTYLAIPELVRKVWAKPNALAWYLAPTYRQAKQIAWRELKETGRDYLAEKPNETDLSVSLIGGGRIALRGAANYDALRGPGLDFAVLDEYADMAPAVWTEIIR
ncbi:MAG: terminase family protein, partial [Candidatus Solibacter sp.]